MKETKVIKSSLIASPARASPTRSAVCESAFKLSPRQRVVQPLFGVVWRLPDTAFNLKNLLLRREEANVILRLVLEDAGFVEVYQEQFDAVAPNDSAFQERIR